MKKVVLLLIVLPLFFILLFTSCTFGLLSLESCLYSDIKFSEASWGSIVSDNRDCINYKLNENYLLTQFYNNDCEICWIDPDSDPDLFRDSVEICKGDYMIVYCSEKQILACSADKSEIAAIDCKNKTVSYVSSLDDFKDDIENYFRLELVR